MSVLDTVPSFVTHYYMRNRPPFLNLSDVPEAQLDVVLGALKSERASGRNARPFGRGYLRMRRACERMLRDLFVARGGTPQRSAPHYFVLGSSAWFEGLSPDYASVTLPIAALPPEAASITYPDSFTAMALAPEFGLPYAPRPYHGQVFLLDELPALIATHGLPEDMADEDYATFADRPFENYVEVQLWSDEPILRTGS
jgi:hypothetical protein